MNKIVEEFKDILDHAKSIHHDTTEQMAEVLADNDCIPLPVNIGYTVYFVVDEFAPYNLFPKKSIIERRVSRIIYDGEVMIESNLSVERKVKSLLSGYFGKTVFRKEIDASKAIVNMDADDEERKTQIVIECLKNMASTTGNAAEKQALTYAANMLEKRGEKK